MVERKIVKKLDRLKAFLGLPLRASWNNYAVLKTALQCEEMDVVLFLLSTDCRVNSEANVIDNTPLHYAVRLEDTELVRILMSKGALLTSQNEKGDTPLHVAAMSRNTEIVDLLLQNIESTHYVNPANNFGLTHMHIACMRNKPDVVKKFLINGVKKDISINSNSALWPGYTLLHIAIEFCCLDVVQLLIEQRIDNCHAKGIYPYSLSYNKYQNASMVNYFMATHYTFCTDNLINFHVACLDGDKRIVEKYLKYGASCNTHITNRAIYEYDTPLHCAARSDSVEVVKLLLKSNADIYSINDWYMTPLHAAFYIEANSDFHQGVFKLLYSAYNFKEDKHITDKNGLSFFHIICTQGDNKLIKYLLKTKSVDINSQIDVFDGFNDLDFLFYTPLHLAIYYQEAETVKLLLQYGADIVKGQETPLELALSRNDEDVIEAIMESTVNLSTVKKNTGENPFHMLLMNNEYHDYQNIINMLYEKGCDVNSQTDNGDTPLHKGYLSYVVNIKAVLDIGADINIENLIGETPFMTARNKESSLQNNEFWLSTLYTFYQIYLSHVEKLKNIGFYVSEKNRLCIKELFQEQAEIHRNRWYPDPKYYSILQHKYKNEIEKMTRIKVSSYSSLYDILFKDANHMAFYCNSKKFLNIINSNDFDNQFPSYGYLLKLQLKKGKDRYAILKPAKDALEFILKKELPDCCLEKVLSYLNDDDLKIIIKITPQIVKNLRCDKSRLRGKGQSVKCIKRKRMT